LGASVRAIAIALKCPHPGCDRATLKHSLSINDLCSSGMASPLAKSFLARRKRPARYSGWLVVLAIFTGARRALFCGPYLRLGLWRAFLAQGDQAIAMASYAAGPLDEGIIDKVRAVIGAWQRLLAFLTAELARDAEGWTLESGHGTRQ
jgi:hypothetical protein